MTSFFKKAAGMIASPARAYMATDDVESGLSSLTALTSLSGTAFSSLSSTTLHPTTSEARSMKYACAQEAGYKYVGDDRMPIHDTNEDVAYTDPTLFCLADGHGGRQASAWFVAQIRIRFTAFRTRSLADPLARQILTKEIINMFQQMDEDYLEIKRGEYAAFLGGVGGKPVDDGCTLNVSMLIDGFLVNCNVGDTRAVLGVELSDTQFAAPPPIQNYTMKYRQQEFGLVPSAATNTADISTLFASCDHNMTHPGKIGHILQQQGAFITNANPVRFHTVQPPTSRSNRPYSELIGARIYVPKSPLPYLSNRRTLNLSSTMGDLLFKPTLSSVPDVRFTKLIPGVKFLLVMGTDGVWDHLEGQTSQDVQNLEVLGWVRERIEEVGVKGVVEEMCVREGGLYCRERQGRVDDVSFIVAQFEL